MNRRGEEVRLKSFTRRAMVLAGGKSLLLGALAARMYYLQVVEGDRYRLMADKNRINIKLLAPPRGRILDRYGAELAANSPNFQVVIIPEQVDDLEKTLLRLSRLFSLTERDLARLHREIRKRRSYLPTTVADNLSWEEFARVGIHLQKLPGVQLSVGDTRYYPYVGTAAHVVGYVGKVSERDLAEGGGDPLLELPGFRIGKTGIEKAYDKRLRGTAGNSRVEVNAYGREIRELERREGGRGEDIRLTLDIALQEFAMKRLGEESGGAVVMDIYGGEILAMASSPSFDPNVFNRGISSKEWHELISNPRKPLADKAAGGLYPPGSTFKMVVAMAALEAGVVTPETTFFCPGYLRLGKSLFHCWKRGGHGRVNLLEAITQSCDVYFYEIARKVGVDRIAEMANRFGLGKMPEINLPAARAGLIPTRAWKLASIGRRWQQGETLVTGIGQGYVQASPLQLALMTARLANGGRPVAAKLVVERGAEAAELPEPVVSQAVLRPVLEGMIGVTSGRRGTARRAQIKEPQWRMAGKTGTAQVKRITKAERDSRVLKNEERPWEERDHALFVAYAPIEKPRYAVAVVIEHGGSGSGTAAPVARDILRETQRLDPLGRPGRERLVSDDDAWRRG